MSRVDVFGFRRGTEGDMDSDRSVTMRLREKLEGTTVKRVRNIVKKSSPLFSGGGKTAPQQTFSMDLGFETGRTPYGDVPPLKGGAQQTTSTTAAKCEDMGLQVEVLTPATGSRAAEDFAICAERGSSVQDLDIDQARRFSLLESRSVITPEIGSFELEAREAVCSSTKFAEANEPRAHESAEEFIRGDDELLSDTDFGLKREVKEILVDKRKRNESLTGNEYESFDAHMKKYNQDRSDNLPDDERTFRGVIRYFFSVEDEPQYRGLNVNSSSYKSEDSFQASNGHVSLRNIVKKRSSRCQSFEGAGSSHLKKQTSFHSDKDYYLGSLKTSSFSDSSTATTDRHPKTYIPFIENYVSDNIACVYHPIGSLAADRNQHGSDPYCTLSISSSVPVPPHLDLSLLKEFDSSSDYQSPLLQPEFAQAPQSAEPRDKTKLTKLFKRREHATEDADSECSASTKPNSVFESLTDNIPLPSKRAKTFFSRSLNTSSPAHSDVNMPESIRARYMRRSATPRAVIDKLIPGFDDQQLQFPCPALFSEQRAVIVLGKVLEREGCVVLVQDDHHHVKVDFSRRGHAMSGMFHVERLGENGRIFVSFKLGKKQKRASKKDKILQELYERFFADIANEFERVAAVYISSVGQAE